MNKIKKKFYNPEKDLTEMYTEEFIIEKCKVKDIDDLIVNHHYWRDSNDELWADFDNPMENVKSDFNAYRNRKRFMSPKNIKQLRNQLNLTVREFAELTGLGYSNISQIENNQKLQTKYQDVMFKLIEAQYRATGEILKNSTKDNLTDALNQELTTEQSIDSTLYSNNTNLESSYSYNNDKTLGDAA